VIRYLTVYEPGTGGNCPYCKANLKSISDNVIGYAYVTNCPFCHQRIYGSYGEAGGVGWTTVHPFKLALICIVGGIVLSVIIIIFLIKTGYIDKIT